MTILQRSKKIFLRITSILVGLLVGLIFAELICRMYLFGWDAFAFRKVNSFSPIGYSGYIKPADNQYVWFDLKPNVSGLFKMNPIRTNSRGLRDKEYTLHKPENTFRVAVVGDSYTFGDGVKVEETYHSLLEERLNCLSDDVRFEFINFGLGGYNLLNYKGVIESKVLAYQPDLILIGFCGNNDDDIAKPPQYSERFKGHRFIKYAWFIRHFQLVRSIGTAVDIRRRKEGAIKQHRGAEKKAFVAKMFSEFAQIQEKSGVPILIFYLSMADALPGKAQFVRGLAEENEFQFIDSSPMVDAIPDISQYWFHSTDHHPNAEMHRMYADILQRHFVVVKKQCVSLFMGNVGDRR